MDQQLSHDMEASIRTWTSDFSVASRLSLESRSPRERSCGLWGETTSIGPTMTSKGSIQEKSLGNTKNLAVATSNHLQN